MCRQYFFLVVLLLKILWIFPYTQVFKKIQNTYTHLYLLLCLGFSVLVTKAFSTPWLYSCLLPGQVVSASARLTFRQNDLSLEVYSVCSEMAAPWSPSARGQKHFLPSNCDHWHCLQTSSNIPWEAKMPHVFRLENHCSRTYRSALLITLTFQSWFRWVLFLLEE